MPCRDHKKPLIFSGFLWSRWDYHPPPRGGCPQGHKGAVPLTLLRSYPLTIAEIQRLFVVPLGLLSPRTPKGCRNDYLSFTTVTTPNSDPEELDV